MRANSFRGRYYTGHIAFRGIEVLVKTNPPFSPRPFLKLERFLRLSRRARFKHAQNTYAHAHRQTLSRITFIHDPLRAI